MAKRAVPVSKTALSRCAKDGNKTADIKAKGASKTTSQFCDPASKRPMSDKEPSNACALKAVTQYQGNSSTEAHAAATQSLNEVRFEEVKE